jgi:hypothetical protein
MLLSGVPDLDNLEAAEFDDEVDIGEQPAW